MPASKSKIAKGKSRKYQETNGMTAMASSSQARGRWRCYWCRWRLLEKGRQLFILVGKSKKVYSASVVLELEAELTAPSGTVPSSTGTHSAMPNGRRVSSLY